MSRFEVHEVDGTTHFVPVQILSTYNNSCHIQIHTPSGPRDLIVDKVYSFPKTPKAVVPRFVAEWMEKTKKECLTMAEGLDQTDSELVRTWYYNNGEIFARAWLDGYEVEREEVSSNQVPTVFDKETLKKMVLDAAMWHLHCGNHKWPIDDMLKQIDKAFEEGGGTR